MEGYISVYQGHNISKFFAIKGLMNSKSSKIASQGITVTPSLLQMGLTCSMTLCTLAGLNDKINMPVCMQVQPVSCF